METKSMFLVNFKSHLNTLRIIGIHLLLLISCNKLMAQVLVPAQAGVMESGGSAIPNLLSPQSLFVKGNYAYVVGQGNGLEILDITLPAQPLHKGAISDGAGGAFLKSPSCVFVSGNYAYVVSGFAYALEIVDVSNPSVPAHKGSIQYSTGTISSNPAPVVYVSGNYAYIGCDVGLFIIDISNPASPVYKSTIGTGQLYISSISVVGNYAYTISYNGVSAVNVSNPASPIVKAININIPQYSFLSVSGNYGYVAVDGSLQIVDLSKSGLPVVGTLNDGGGSSPFLKSPSSIFVSGNYAFITSTFSNSVQMVDVSVPNNPVALASIQNGGSVLLNDPTSVFVVGNYVYVSSAGSNALEIIQLNASTPATGSAGSLANGSGALLSNPESVFLSGNYAYVASFNNNALEVVDLTNPGSPLHKSSLTDGTGGAALKGPQSVFVAGNYAYLASKTSNALEIVDVTNPASPVHKGVLNDGGGAAPYINTPQSVCVSGNYAYVASSGSNALEIIDISTPGMPSHKGSLTDGTGSALLNNLQSVFVMGNYAYVASKGSNALEIVDVTNPAAPVHKASLTNGTGGASIVNPVSVWVSGSYAYIAGKTNLEIVDVSNPAAPVHSGSINVSSPTSVMVSGGYAYVAGFNGASVINVNDPRNPTLIYQAYLPCGQVTSSFVHGPYLYSTYNTSICQPFQVNNLNLSLSHVGSLVNSGGALIDDPQSVFISGNYAYVVNGGDYTSSGKGSLEIVDISNPTSPLHKGSLIDGTNGAVLTYPTSVFVSGNYAFVTCRVLGSAGTNALEIIDISNPSSPVHKGKLLDGNGAAPYLNTPASVYVSGNYAYIASSGSNKLEVVDVTNPAAPVHKVSLADGSGGASLLSPKSVFVSGTYVYVASTGSNVLEIVNVSGSLVLTHIKTVSVTTPEAVFVSGNYAYVAKQSGMNVIDISTPSSAAVVGTLFSGSSGVAPYLNGCTSVYVSGNYAYITNNGSGSHALEIVDITNPASPQHKAGLLDGGGFQPQLYYPWSVAVSGNYAFVASGGNSALSIFYLYSPQINLPLPSGAVGSSLTIKGQNFDTFVTASIGGVPATVTSVSATSITLTVPQGVNIGKLTLSSDKVPAVTSTTNLLISPTASSATVAQNSFTANWSNVGAVSYRLDVATDNGFTSLVAGYNNRIVKNTSCYVTGLTAGTAYYYRVKSYDSTSYSVYSSTIPVPSTPVSTSASSISQSGFTANWNAVSGAVTNYFLDVASDNAFQNFVPGYNNLSVSSSSTSQIVTGLNPGTYYYRVRSANSGGTSFSSSAITVITIPANPAASAASSIGLTTFTANWQTATPATGYLLDVSTDNFATFVSGYNGLVVASTTQAVTLPGANAGLVHQYRVRATNASGTSGYSNTISVITIPTAPVASAASLISNTSFTANWALSNGATSYTVDWSIDNFATVLGSSPPLGNVSSYVVNGNPATQYYYRVTASNQTGSSNTSNVVAVKTIANPATTQSSGLTFSNLTSSTITLNFIAGSGASHLVVASVGSPLVTGLPVNQTSYTANTSFGLGSPVGNGFVISKTNATSVALTNLTTATTYFFQVFDYNGSGGTENYNTTTASNNPANQATLASSSSISQPANLTFFNKTSAGTSASFTAAQGSPAGYIVLRSASSGLPSPPVNGTTYTAGNTIGSATVIYSGASTSFNDSGLSSATPYYYSIYSYNGSGSSISYLTSNPLQGSITTFTTMPTTQSSALLFSNVSSTSITVDFTQGNGAGHLVVINSGGPLNSPPVNGSTYVASTQFGQGSPIGTGYVVSKGTSSTVTINNLSPSTTYYFQVFDFNGAGGTEGYNNSTATGNPLSQSTISPVPLNQPANLSFSGKTASSVNVSFSSPTNAPSGYLVLRSSVSGTPSQIPVSGTAYAIGTTIGNSVIASVGPNVSFFDGGLSTGLIYYYTVYSYNGNGSTSSYLTSNPLQGSVVLDTTPPVVSFPVANPLTVTDGNTPTFNATAIDNISVSAVQFYYRGITQSNFQSIAMNPGVNGNYSVQVQASWYDSLGLEYYVIATDENGNSSAKNASYYTRLIKPSISLPQLPSGSGVESYRIVSFPYLLSTGNDVTTVYPNVPWNDDTKSGLWWWNPTLSNGAGAYDRYGKSATLKTVDPGKGYWAITSSPFTPQLSNVPSPNYSRDKLYQMNLKPGWNEVGNPYPVAISWDDVIAYNQSIGSANFGKLNIYNGQAIKEATGTTMLKAFEGGFVKNLTSSDITIQIPFPGQTSGGRIAAASVPDLSQEAWKVFLHITQDGLVNELGGFGMQPNATQGEDVYDNFNIPMFMTVPELHFSQKNAPGILFSTDVVNTQPNYVWTFEPQGISGKETRLTWNPEIILNGDKQLFLLDVENMNLVNMSEISSYSFTMSAGSKFKIYYGKNAQYKISDEGLMISAPYPNPVTVDNKTMFKLLLPAGGRECSVDVQLYTLQGESIYSATHYLPSGIQSIQLDWNTDLASGIYIYKVTASNSELRKTTTGKLVKP